MSSTRPKVTFGLPVRNGTGTIERCMDSLLAQDLRNIEILVSDNASTDGTQDVIRRYAKCDSRVRPILNETDVGQIENFNRVVRMGAGEYVRWIGADDWVEPEYASTCASVLDAHPDVIAVATFMRIHLADGNTRYAEYRGELLESTRPETRFRRLMWTFHAGDTVFDPLYSLIRRDVLANTDLIPMMVKADRILAAELALIGPFVRVEECLAHRWKPVGETVHSEKYLKRYRPDDSAALQTNSWRQFRALASVISKARLSRIQKLLCLRAALSFFLVESRIQSRRHFRQTRRAIGLTRRNLPFSARRSKGEPR